MGDRTATRVYATEEESQSQRVRPRSGKAMIEYGRRAGERDFAPTCAGGGEDRTFVQACDFGTRWSAQAAQSLDRARPSTDSTHPPLPLAAPPLADTSLSFPGTLRSTRASTARGRLLWSIDAAPPSF